MPFLKLMPMQGRLYALRRQFFLQAAYTLTSAAMMGSSIGLVLYQSQQLQNLNTFHRHSSGTTLHTSDASVPTPSSPPSSASSSATTTLPFLVLTQLQSMWFPLALWCCSLAFASSYLGSPGAGLVPERMSARTGVLVSQGMFAVFWVLLGCMQQVQEMLRVAFWSAAAVARDVALQYAEDPHQSTATATAPPLPLSLSSSTLTTALEDQSFSTMSSFSSSSSFLLNDPHEFWQRARVPWWIVWHMAIVLLGLSTGLLTSCSYQLEGELYTAYDDELERMAEEEAEAECDEKSKEKKHGEQGSSRAMAETKTKHGGAPGDLLIGEEDKDEAEVEGSDRELQRALNNKESSPPPPLLLLHHLQQQQQQQPQSSSRPQHSIIIPVTTTTRTMSRTSDHSSSIFHCSLLSRAQRVFLAGLLLTLLIVQVCMFQWMVKTDYQHQRQQRLYYEHAHEYPDHQSQQGQQQQQQQQHHHRDWHGEQWLHAPMTFGLFFGVAMLVLGARLYPKRQLGFSSTQIMSPYGV
ncbi:hypothetical protein DFQ26_008793 [Actinomortierella ambigua]|nr:hypothetical protein DFQ26_008793 [Actinomortierella ambigua]